MALFGTPIEKQIKKFAAETEAAWKGVGHTEGLQIWRIEKFHVVAWPEAQYGEFFNGDSYILLKTRKVENAFSWDVHFWLGSHTTQDEAGTAAYKTVELDDFLDGYPVEHREVEGHESDKFIEYFPHGIKVLRGGIDSGFHHVTADEHRARLLQIKGRLNNCTCREVALSASSLNSGDAFVLDNGQEVWLFIGQRAGIAEKTKGNQMTRALDDERGSTVNVHVVAEFDMHATDDATNKFWQLLGGRVEHITSAEQGGSDADVGSHKALYQLSDESGELNLTSVPFARSSLNGSDVFIIDVGAEVFVWIGQGASEKERKYAMHYGQQYLNTHNRPAWLPLTRVLQGAENELLLSYFN